MPSEVRVLEVSSLTKTDNLANATFPVLDTSTGGAKAVTGQAIIDKVSNDLIPNSPKIIEIDKNDNLTRQSINRVYIVYGLDYTKSGNQVLISKLEIQGVWNDVKNSDNQYTVTFPEINGITLNNADGIIANYETKTLEVVSNILTTVYVRGGEKKDLICVNFFGKLISPFSTIQSSIDAIRISPIEEKIKEVVGIHRVVASDVYTPSFFNFPVDSDSTYTVEINTGLFDNYPSYWYFTKALIGTGFYIPIPSQYRKVGYKFRIYVTYTCNTNFVLNPYCRNENNTAWVNNAGATPKTFLASDASNTDFVERSYEQGMGYVAFYTGNYPGFHLKISSIVLVCEASELKSDSTVSVKRITVAPSGGDYTSIRSAITSITDASSYNRYEVFVKNGTYTEFDIRTKNYVDVIGESREGVIVWSDGSSTELSPTDYSWNPSEYGGVPINSIPKAWRHQWWLVSESTIKNMTLRARDVKYLVHQDQNTGSWTSTIENCRLIREQDAMSYGTDYDRGLLDIIGVGARAGQHTRYIDLCFEYLLDNQQSSTAVYWHNWHNQSISCKGTMINCVAMNAKNLLVFNDLGNNNIDEFYIENCIGRNVLYTGAAGYYDPDIDKVPYSIRVNGIKNSFDITIPTANEVDRRLLGYRYFNDSQIFKTVTAFDEGQKLKITNGVFIIATEPEATHICKRRENNISYIQSLWNK